MHNNNKAANLQPKQSYKNNKNKHQGTPATKKHSRGTHTPAEQKVDRMESKGSLEASGEGGVVNYAGHGEHTPAREIYAQARGTHAPARALLVNDWAAALGSKGAGDDDRMARVGPGLPE
jgi:hypothetical protein